MKIVISNISSHRVKRSGKDVISASESSLGTF